MLEQKIARLRAHRNNIHRYRRLLRTQLIEIERDFITRRLAEEEAAMERLSSETFPVTFALPAATPTIEDAGHV
jgi:hypothetical protein